MLCFNIGARDPHAAAPACAHTGVFISNPLDDRWEDLIDTTHLRHMVHPVQIANDRHVYELANLLHWREKELEKEDREPGKHFNPSTNLKYEVNEIKPARYEGMLERDYNATVDALNDLRRLHGVSPLVYMKDRDDYHLLKFRAEHAGKLPETTHAEERTARGHPMLEFAQKPPLFPRVDDVERALRPPMPPMASAARELQLRMAWDDRGDWEHHQRDIEATDAALALQLGIQEARAHAERALRPPMPPMASTNHERDLGMDWRDQGVEATDAVRNEDAASSFEWRNYEAEDPLFETGVSRSISNSAQHNYPPETFLDAMGRHVLNSAHALVRGRQRDRALQEEDLDLSNTDRRRRTSSLGGWFSTWSNHR
jgi:hypothetical protein